MTTKCEQCGQPRRPGDWPWCEDGSGRHGHARPHGGTLLQAIHTLDRAVVFRNPATGEIRTPARNDTDMPDAYKRAGFVREEIDTHQKRRDLEKEGHFMEAAYYDNGSATAEREIDAAAGPSTDGSCVGLTPENALTLQDLKDAGLQD